MNNTTILPSLPGYSFSNSDRKKLGLSQTLKFSKGCPLSDTIVPDTGKYALELLDAENRLYDDALIEQTYGKRKSFLKKTPVPEFVLQENKVLRFYGYFREDIDDCWGEEFRIHFVKIHYYLVNDTIEIFEPIVPNSGLTQGKLLKRQVVPRPDGKAVYSWKDLNLGIDLIIYGKRIRIIDCDIWTKEYLESAGIILNPRVDDLPEDTFAKKCRERELKPLYEKQAPEEEKLWKFLNLDRQVLRFYGLWDDTNNQPPEKRKVVVQYYLVNDTMEVLEVHSKNNGRDPYPVLIRRQKIPLDVKALPETFPSSYLEYSDKEIKEWFMPRNLCIGKTVVVFKRKILLYDCDLFTRQYYRQNFNAEMPEAINVEEKPKPPVAKLIPPHTGLGTWEDSLQSCIYNIPKRPYKDVLKIMYNDNKFLRYSAHMDTVWEIDRSREFIITFFPGDDTVSIFERCIPNSGIAKGPFLKRCRLQKLGITDDGRPLYCNASDFYIGATVHAAGRKFVIDDADKYVLLFMEANPGTYTEEALEAHRSKTGDMKLAKEPACSRKMALQRELRRCIIEQFGEKPMPLPFDLGHHEQQLELVFEKLIASNVPIPPELLEKALDICCTDNGKVDVDALQKIFLFAFGNLCPEASAE